MWMLTLAGRLIAAVPLKWWLLAALFAAGAIYHWRATSAAYDRGKADALASVYADNLRRLNDANRADEDARRCAADPACRLSNDGFRRD